MPTLVIPTARPSGAQIAAVPAAEVEWAPASFPMDAPSWTVFGGGRVRNVSARNGRPRELDRFAAATLAVNLDNLDRAIDPMYSAGPWYGRVEPERRVRYRVRYQGVSYPRSAGFIDGFPQVVNWGTRDATVALTATGAFKMLAQCPLPSSMYELAVAIDQPAHWWKLDEKTGITAVDSGYAPVLSPGVHIGATLGTAGLVPFDGGRTMATYSGINAGILTQVPAGAPTTSQWSVECWFKCPGTVVFANDYPTILAFGAGQAGFGNRAVATIANGTSPVGELAFSVFTSTSTAFVTSAVALDGNAAGGATVHHMVATWDDNTRILTLYVDGVSQGTATATSGTVLPFVSDNVYIGGRPESGNGSFPTDGGGSIVGEVAIYRTLLTAAQVLDHYNAGKTAFSGERTGTRVTRVLDYAGYPGGPARNIQTGSSTVGAYDLPGGKVQDYLQLLAETEQGQYYEDLEGVLTWRQRSDLLTATRSKNSRATFGDGGTTYKVITANTAAGAVALGAVSPSLTAADVGSVVVGPGIPSGATLATQAGGSGTLSVAATLTQSGAQLHVGEMPYVNVDLNYDETRVWNDITVGRQGGSPQRVIDAASIRKYGRQGFSPRTNLLYVNDNDANDAANWVRTHHANALQRVVGVTVDMTDATMIPIALGLSIGDRITIVRRPQKLGTPIVADLIIQGIEDTHIPGKMQIRMPLDAAETQQYWIWDDPNTTWDSGTRWGF